MEFIFSGSSKTQLTELAGSIFKAFPGSIAYIYRDGSELFGCAAAHDISAVFLDGKWDEPGGFQVLTELREKFPRIPVIVFADDDSLYEDALWYEAAAYVTTPYNPEKLKAAFHEAENTMKDAGDMDI